MTIFAIASLGRLQHRLATKPHEQRRVELRYFLVAGIVGELLQGNNPCRRELLDLAARDVGDLIQVIVAKPLLVADVLPVADFAMRALLRIRLAPGLRYVRKKPPFDIAVVHDEVGDAEALFAAVTQANVHVSRHDALHLSKQLGEPLAKFTGEADFSRRERREKK